MLAALAVVVASVSLPSVPLSTVAEGLVPSSAAFAHPHDDHEGDCKQWWCDDDESDDIDDTDSGSDDSDASDECDEWWCDADDEDNDGDDTDVPDLDVPTVTPTAPPTETPAETSETSNSGDTDRQIEIRLAHANLPGRAPAVLFGRHIRQLASHRPDFITLNEVNRRSRAQITPDGYESYRSKASAFTAETPVLWRTSRWTKISDGTAYLTTRRVKWGTRAVNWVTVRHNDSGEVVSVISAHPAPNRPHTAGLFKSFMRGLVDLTGQLATQGDVLIGGDLNVGYRGRRWPAALLREANLKTNYGRFGRPVAGTHDGGAIIDYILFRKTDRLRFVKTGTRRLAGSDHHGIWAEFKIRY